MKIRVLSDLHLENDEPELIPHAHADLIVLAGDIHNHAAGPRWAAQTFDGAVPVVYVPGNHEYYDGEFGALETALYDAAAQVDNVHVLNNAALVDPQGRCETDRAGRASPQSMPWLAQSVAGRTIRVPNHFADLDAFLARYLGARMEE